MHELIWQIIYNTKKNITFLQIERTVNTNVPVHMCIPNKHQHNSPELTFNER